jgi:hypothetical protein
MKPHFVLVDFENVQPRNLGHLQAGRFHIKVFVGASQSKITLELARALQAFGSDAEYIQIAGSGSNALDFHIAFYIGRLAAEHPQAGFTIVSRDTGFDPLIRHLAALDIVCTRVKAITDIVPGRSAHVATPTPAPRRKQTTKKAAKAAPAPAHFDEVVARLVKLKAARPATLKKLGSSMLSWFKPPLSEAEVDALLAQLARAGKITITGTKVSYTL